MCAIPILNYFNTKVVLIVCLLANAASLFLFTVSENYYIYLLSRFLVGFFQVFFCIYFPVWVSLFQTNPKKQTMWFTLLTLGVPLGVILGYIVTSVVILWFNVT